MTDVTNANILIVSDVDAYSRHQRIVDLRNKAEQTFLELGAELFLFEKEEQYLELGYSTFNEYLADPDVNIARSVAFKLKGVYETFVLGLGVSPERLLPAGYTKLDIVRPYVSEANVEEWLGRASTLSRRDLTISLKEAYPPAPLPPLPEGKYRVIYADPWSTGATLEELKTLPVSDLTGDDAVLFLWAGNLSDTLELAHAWGFTHKAELVWNKQTGGGYNPYINEKHELLLVCTKGNCKPETSDLPSSMVHEPAVREGKPEIFRRIIDELYPQGTRIQLFTKNHVPEGWDTWGKRGEYGSVQLRNSE